MGKGGRLTLPVGCYHLEDWLLDAINVPKLLNLLQTGACPFFLAAILVVQLLRTTVSLTALTLGRLQ